jgi:hypothetical protein
VLNLRQGALGLDGGLTGGLAMGETLYSSTGLGLEQDVRVRVCVE